MLIFCHGPWDISNGCSSSDFLWCWTLFYWHLKQPCIYFLTSSFSPSHQSFLLINSSIHCCLGCPTSTKSWFSCRIFSLSFLLFGTYILSSIYTIPSSSYDNPLFFSNVWTTSHSLVLFLLISFIISKSSVVAILLNIITSAVVLFVHSSSLSNWTFLFPLLYLLGLSLTRYLLSYLSSLGYVVGWSHNLVTSNAI